ncbi:hypothetical protein [Geopseudomonas sagittaria]|uniref:hypothetical protein n=1 Tax=Geopseudomonas sagittaria TaxID=1135990 RepID=UPI00111445CC|nr:hypothetical protein [Pseudomonas sagittaria]
MPAETQTIYVVWTNTDLTEGRGHQIPIAYALSQTTARRIASRRGVQGSDAEVQPFEAILHRGRWCAPVSIERPSKADEEKDRALAAAAAARAARDAAIEKARSMGMTEEDLKALGGGA